MKYDIRQLRLLSNEAIAKGIYDMRLAYGENEIPVQCGQFAHVYVPGKSLRRPISVCDARDGVLRLVYQVKGEGTKIMSQMKQGEQVDVLVPLGNGFCVDKEKKYALIGGGIGVPPMLYTAAQCKEPLAITGFRSRELVILQEDFAQAGAEAALVTDDGSAGKKGFVTDVLRERIAGSRARLRGIRKALSDLTGGANGVRYRRMSGLRGQGAQKRGGDHAARLQERPRIQRGGGSVPWLIYR